MNARNKKHLQLKNKVTHLHLTP